MTQMSLMRDRPISPIRIICGQTQAQDYCLINFRMAMPPSSAIKRTT